MCTTLMVDLCTLCIRKEVTEYDLLMRLQGGDFDGSASKYDTTVSRKYNVT